MNLKKFGWILAAGFAVQIVFACKASDNSEKIAEVDGVAIHRSEGKSLSTAREQVYKLERQKLDEYIGATLLTREAKRQSISVSTLMEREVDNKVAPITEDNIKSFYEENRIRL